MNYGSKLVLALHPPFPRRVLMVIDAGGSLMSSIHAWSHPVPREHTFFGVWEVARVLAGDTEFALLVTAWLCSLTYG